MPVPDPGLNIRLGDLQLRLLLQGLVRSLLRGTAGRIITGQDCSGDEERLRLGLAGAFKLAIWFLNKQQRAAGAPTLEYDRHAHGDYVLWCFNVFVGIMAAQLGTQAFLAVYGEAPDGTIVISDLVAADAAGALPAPAGAGIVGADERAAAATAGD